MNRRSKRLSSLRSHHEAIERLVQANIGLVLAQAVIIRLSIELANDRNGEPDPLILVAFLATFAVAVVIVMHLGRAVRRLPRRGIRIVIAIATILLQATAFQMIHAYAS